MKIRKCNLSDLPYLYEICWKTGGNGNSVENMIDDKYKIGHYYAAPYVIYDSSFCFTATENNIPKGYILGTSHTINYSEWLNKKWLPEIRDLYDLSKKRELTPSEEYINSCIINDTVPDEALSAYPAHLHIDLLPELQGKGIGRKLMEIFFDRCREKGVEGIHLGVSKKNPGAIAFYSRMEMKVIVETEGALTLGIKL